jgi:GDP-L-fucose synthase
MLTNLYGKGDNYNLQNSHVLPAMIRKFHEAKVNSHDEVILWGSGSPMREFLHTDDLAEACLFLMNNYSSAQFLNVGTGIDVTIKELAEKVSRTVGFKGTISWDLTKPDGTPRKLMDVSKINTSGWKHQIDLDKGINLVYEDFLKNINTLRF